MLTLYQELALLVTGVVLCVVLFTIGLLGAAERLRRRYAARSVATVRRLLGLCWVVTSSLLVFLAIYGLMVQAHDPGPGYLMVPAWLLLTWLPLGIAAEIWRYRDRREARDADGGQAD